MKITPAELDFPLATSDPHRGEGLHISDIYNDLYQDLEPLRYEQSDDGPPDLLMALGTAWEQYLEKVLVANGVLCARPGELESPEGIKYSPDLLIVNGQDRLGEIKFTFLSSKVGPTEKKFDKYLCQGMAYCYLTEIPRMRYYILHVNGIWSFKIENGHFPHLKVWDVEFTARELQDNYRMLMKHAQDKGLLPHPITKRRQR